MRTAALLLLAGLAACSSSNTRSGNSNHHTVARAPALESPPPAAIDGRYRGIARLIRADTTGCPRSGPRTVTVESGTLTITYRATARASAPLSAAVGSDGSIHGSDGSGAIDGQISGRHMDLTVTSPICDVRYALDRM